MRQPEDNRTLDLLETAKRRPGRPRSENPLSTAERARRYRKLQKTKQNGQDEARKYAAAAELTDDLKLKISQLNQQNVQLCRDLANAVRVIDLLVEYSDSNREVPDEVLQCIAKSRLHFAECIATTQSSSNSTVRGNNE